jgi:hypothetical protein
MDGVVSTVQSVAAMNIDLKLNLNLGLIHFRHLMRVSLIIRLLDKKLIPPFCKHHRIFHVHFKKLVR